MWLHSYKGTACTQRDTCLAGLGNKVPGSSLLKKEPLKGIQLEMSPRQREITWRSELSRGESKDSPGKRHLDIRTQSTGKTAAYLGPGSPGQQHRGAKAQLSRFHPTNRCTAVMESCPLGRDRLCLQRREMQNIPWQSPLSIVLPRVYPKLLRPQPWLFSFPLLCFCFGRRQLGTAERICKGAISLTTSQRNINSPRYGGSSGSRATHTFSPKSPPLDPSLSDTRRYSTSMSFPLGQKA